MKHLTDLLKKYTKLEPTDRKIKNAVQQAFKQVLDLDIETENISYTNKVVRISGSGLLKSKIHTSKKALLDYLEQELDEASPKDIR